MTISCQSEASRRLIKKITNRTIIEVKKTTIRNFFFINFKSLFMLKFKTFQFLWCSHSHCEEFPRDGDPGDPQCYQKCWHCDRSDWNSPYWTFMHTYHSFIGEYSEIFYLLKRVEPFQDQKIEVKCLIRRGIIKLMKFVIK